MEYVPEKRDIVIFFEGNDSKGMAITNVDYTEFSIALCSINERQFFTFSRHNSGLEDFSIKVNLAQIRFVEVKNKEVA